MKNIVVGLGEILWDVFPTRKVLGGAPANFAYHISQFGFNGYAVSAIGNDLLGKEILTSLEKKKLNYLIETTDYPTGNTLRSRYTALRNMRGSSVGQYSFYATHRKSGKEHESSLFRVAGTAKRSIAYDYQKVHRSNARR